MRSLNRVMLLGNLAADVEFRQTKGGYYVANFPLATNHVYRDSDGNKKSLVDFHRVLAWGRLGEICNEYLVKGTAILVEGRIANSSFEDKEGNKRFKTEIIARDVNILTWKKKGENSEVGVESIQVEDEEEVDEKELVGA